MVQLLLTTTKGNASSRFFPFHGYLGLTPVRVEGIVRTKLDEDRKLLPTSTISVSVRCYESRIGRSRTTMHAAVVVDHTEVLWSKPPHADWADVGDLELPFKITLPKRTPGFSTANLHDYRTFWRVEAALEHVPMAGVGSRLVRHFDLALIRYDAPSHSHSSLIPPPSAPPHALHLQTNKPRAPVIRYNISTPTHPIGPSDIVFVSLFLQPLDPGVSIRSATLVVERRIEIHHTSALSPTSPTSPDFAAYDVPTPSSSSSHLSPTNRSESPSSPLSPDGYGTSSSSATLEISTSSTRQLLPSSAHPSPPPPIGIPPYPTLHPPPNASPHAHAHTPLSTYIPSSAQPPGDAPRTLAATIASAEGTDFTRDAAGVWSKTLTVQWPGPRSQSRWALGETLHGAYASVRFFAKTRVLAGGDALELEEREICVAATSEAERRLALAKYTEQRDGALRSKSRSPWRARSELPEQDDTGGGARGGGSESAQAKSYPGASPPAAVAAHAVPLPSSHKAPPVSAGVSTGRSSMSATATTAGFAASAGAKARTCLKPRRPHTSAGERDRATFAYGPETRIGSGSSATTATTTTTTSSSHSSGSRPRTGLQRTESGLAESMLYELGAKDAGRERRRASKDKGRGWEREREREREKERERGALRGPTVGGDQVRAWEEELARIEVQSRRSSADMLGSWGFGRRKRVAQRS
ncbi:hypothetical protein AcW1_005625 [Taiwanofungus camphoratus]|nr:hypothetical protein AcW2_004391 [Antrodia cinnamomea]KAI0957137.1 hypothetical protein AcW1_005625 [Antrodia cinnamomea]